MKTLELIDTEGNGASYELCLPDAVLEWSVSGLWAFLDKPLDAMSSVFSVRSPDRLRHETLRRAICYPLSTFQRSVRLVQDERMLCDEDVIQLLEPHTQLLMVRDPRRPMGNPLSVSLAECNRRTFENCRVETVRLVDRLFDFKKTEIRNRVGKRIYSLEELVDSFAEQCEGSERLRVIFRLAEIVHASPFENISKMVSGVPFCSGWEMWARIAEGGGGVCAEKTGALKYILDVLRVESFYVAASQQPFPDDYDRQLKQYIRSEGAEKPPVWVQHLLLGVRLSGNEYLTDVSNGNLPLLFLNSDDMGRYLKAGYRARMVFHVEWMNLRRISLWSGDALLILNEFHVPDLHFQYIFNQGLGLHISSTFYIGAFFDWGGEQTARYQGHYTALAEELRLPCPRFLSEGNLSSLPDVALQTTLEKVLDSLRARYSNPWYTGDFTFVLQPLSPDRWRRPRLSRDVACTVERRGR